jgi:hypothetical protein
MKHGKANQRAGGKGGLRLCFTPYALGPPCLSTNVRGFSKFHVLAIRILVAIAVAAGVTAVIGTPEVITVAIIFTPVFVVSFWLLGFLQKKDS